MPVNPKSLENLRVANAKRSVEALRQGPYAVRLRGGRQFVMSPEDWQKKCQDDREKFFRSKRLEVELRVLKKTRSYAEVKAAGDAQLRPGHDHGGCW